MPLSNGAKVSPQGRWPGSRDRLLPSDRLIYNYRKQRWYPCHPRLACVVRRGHASRERARLLGQYAGLTGMPFPQKRECVFKGRFLPVTRGEYSLSVMLKYLCKFEYPNV